ncbi:selenocysteine-specific translation elongation factor, partial [Ruminococcaceae bacterium OttesenSCG-928-I18]|nr:selenocysteine-specific translation elongation factor [Ruminococcaceae bacterium OttesenSCG-928-I18]
KSAQNNLLNAFGEAQVKNIVIGTAGHVDHGKTLLIKALTGINTDRLKEEQKRGITIDLGFAFLPLPNGERAGIIDVPGHEKFVKNMLAGAGGIDFALLVVAADDGVMPQTREHLGILSLLGIEEGVVVITKTDLVEKDWVELVKEDIKSTVEGTFLEGAPIHAVSAYTGEGIDELRGLIAELVGKTSAKNTEKPFRIPIDRVFTVEGYGTVITGTLIEGEMQSGDEVEVYPSGVRSRVRNLQVHSKDVEVAYAGQRVAVNLAGLKKEELSRGDTLALPDSMENSMMLDVQLRALKDSGRVLLNGSRLHFYHGARDVLAKLILLDRNELRPGEETFAQLRFTENVAAKKGDHYVVRFYSPIETVGGGTVLDPNPKKHRRNDEKVLDSLRIRKAGSVSDNLLQAIEDGSARFVSLKEIKKQLVLDDETFQREYETLVGEGRVIPLSGKVSIGIGFKKQLGEKVRRLLSDFHRDNPLQAGMRRDELRNRVLPGWELSLADKALAVYEQEGLVVSKGQKMALADFTVEYSESDKKMAADMEKLFLDGGYSPPSLDEVLARYPKDKVGAKRVFDALLENGTLYLASPQVFFHSTIAQDAKEKVRAHIEQNGQITLAEFRDLSGTSRKFALPMLESLDRQKFTRMQGDARVLVGK